MLLSQGSGGGSIPIVGSLGKSYLNHGTSRLLHSPRQIRYHGNPSETHNEMLCTGSPA